MVIIVVVGTGGHFHGVGLKRPVGLQHHALAHQSTVAAWQRYAGFAERIVFVARLRIHTSAHLSVQQYAHFQSFVRKIVGQTPLPIGKGIAPFLGGWVELGGQTVCAVNNLTVGRTLKTASVHIAHQATHAGFDGYVGIVGINGLIGDSLGQLTHVAAVARPNCGRVPSKIGLHHGLARQFHFHAFAVDESRVDERVGKTRSRVERHGQNLVAAVVVVIGHVQTQAVFENTQV